MTAAARTLLVPLAATILIGMLCIAGVVAWLTKREPRLPPDIRVCTRCGAHYDAAVGHYHRTRIMVPGDRDD